MKLSPETFYVRRYESKTNERPDKPLTDKEREYLTKTCLKKCISSYVARMTGSGLVSGTDTINDLPGEAFIAFKNIMDKFDKSKCGKIQKYDVPGKTNPKSLEFYFYTYFCGRVNWMACDTRTEKKKRGMVGSSGSLNEIMYNPEDPTSDPERSHSLDAIVFLERELKKQHPDVQRLFEEIYVVGLTTDELRARHPNYVKLRRSLGAFIKDFEEQHHNLLSVEAAGYKNKKKRSKP